MRSGIWALLSAAVMATNATVAAAQSGTPSNREIVRKSYSEWTKGRFSEAVIVPANSKLIFLSGTGPEEPIKGGIQHKDNFFEQCRLAYTKVRQMLEDNGATMANIVKQNVYIVDVRNQADYGKCRREAYSGVSMPASTAVYVTNLGSNGMLFEISIIAAVPQ